MLNQNARHVRLVRLRKAEIEAAAQNRPAEYRADLEAHVVRDDEESVWIPAEDYRSLVDKYKNSKAAGGPGTELKRVLKMFGVTADPNCSCNSRARQMDEWGPDECEQRVGEIVGWLKEQAGARKLPFSRILAKQAVLLAIRRSRKRAQKG
jgi:hypothetical protein